MAKLYEIKVQIECPDSWGDKECDIALNQLGDLSYDLETTVESILKRELIPDLGYKPEENLLPQLKVKTV